MPETCLIGGVLKSKVELEKEIERKKQEESKTRKDFELHLKELFKTKYSSLPEDRKKVLEYDFIKHLNLTNHGKSILKKIKTYGFSDTFLEFYLFNKKKFLSEAEMNFDLWDRTQTLF